jgi:predicted O-methyltransferase YrrM
MPGNRSVLDKLGARLASEWERRRPLPRVRYLANTPAVGRGGPLDPLFPPNTETLGAAAMSHEAQDFVVGVLKKLTPVAEPDEELIFYEWGQAKFGSYWRLVDMMTLLRAAALIVRPEAYLEIGVRRGRSSAIVAATCPSCDIYGFDLWREDYAGSPNPGPDFVRAQLAAVGHAGSLTLTSGDSRETVPAFLREHPGLFFDLITVDGDHSVEGASADLANALPRLKVGGVIVFDDITSAPLLTRVWRDMVARDTRFLAQEYRDVGPGVAAAVRIAEDALIMGRD